MASGLVFQILLGMFCFCGSAVGTRAKLFGAKKVLSTASDDGICKSVVDPRGYVCQEHTYAGYSTWAVGWEYREQAASPTVDGDKLVFQYQEDYAHADYVMAVNAKQVVYNPLMAFFRLQ